MSRFADADEDAVLPVSLGTTVWLVALIVLVAMRGTLDENGVGWWIAAAAVGFVSGACGVLFLLWRRGRRDRRARA